MLGYGVIGSETKGTCPSDLESRVNQFPSSVKGSVEIAVSVTSVPSSGGLVSKTKPLDIVPVCLLR